jgi:hypothetical protein
MVEYEAARIVTSTDPSFPRSRMNSQDEIPLLGTSTPAESRQTLDTFKYCVNILQIYTKMPPSLYANLLDPAAAAATPAATISGAPVKYSFKKEDEAVAPVEKKTPDGT